MKYSELIQNIAIWAMFSGFPYKKIASFINPFSPHACKNKSAKAQTIFYFNLTWNIFLYVLFFNFASGHSLILPLDQLMSQPMAYKDFLFKMEMNPTSLEERAQD